MNAEQAQWIKQQYEANRTDSTTLFQTILSIGNEAGFAYLEQCVIERRLAWLDKNRDTLKITGNPLLDGYQAFYESYLGLSIPRDGEMIAATDTHLVFRWWNRCPTLEACQKLGLETRYICKQVYHQPVQAFLSKINPALRFERNYESLRPHTPYCEEIILLDTSGECDS